MEVAESESSSSSSSSSNSKNEEAQNTPQSVEFNYRMRNMLTTMNNYDYQASVVHYTTPPRTQTTVTPSSIQVTHRPFNGMEPSNTVTDSTTTTVTTTTTTTSPTTYCLTPSGGLTTCVGGTSSSEAGADLVSIGWIALAGVTRVLFWPSLVVTIPIVAGALSYDYQYGPNANAGGALDAGLAEWPDAFEGAWHIIESFPAFDPFAW